MPAAPAPRLPAPLSSSNLRRRPPASLCRRRRRRAHKGRRGAARGGAAGAGRRRRRWRRGPLPPPAPESAGGRARSGALRTYLLVLFVAAVPPLRVAAVGGGGRLGGLPIAVVRALVRAAASPRRRGDGLRARRNSLNIHLHLPVHCIARQKQANTFHHPASFFGVPRSLFLLSAFSRSVPPRPPSPSGGRGTHGSGCTAILPAILPTFVSCVCVCAVCARVSLARWPSAAPTQRTRTEPLSAAEPNSRPRAAAGLSALPASRARRSPAGRGPLNKVERRSGGRARGRGRPRGSARGG